MYSTNKFPNLQEGQTLFQFTFDYLKPDDVQVSMTRADDTTLVEFTLVTENQVKLAQPTQAGDTITVFRTTPLEERAVDFQNGAVLTEKDLDDANMQLFFAMQEAVDKAGTGIKVRNDGLLDAQGAKLANLNNPSNPQDAATKIYVDETDAATIAESQRINDEGVAHVTQITDDAMATVNADKQVVLTTREHVQAMEDHVTAMDAHATEQATYSEERASYSEEQADRAESEADRAAANATLAGAPLGSYVWFPADNPDNVKDRHGLLVPNGRELKRETFKDLWNEIERGGLPSVSEAEWQAGQKAVFSTGDGATTFRLPSIGGYFVRVAGGIDPDVATRRAGDTQDSANKAHMHHTIEQTIEIGGGAHDHEATFTGTPMANHEHFVVNSGRVGGSDSPNITTGNAVAQGISNPSYGYGSYALRASGTSANVGKSSPKSAGTPAGKVAITTHGEHVHNANIPELAVCSSGSTESRPSNVWMQPYIVWYQANNATLGGFRLRGSWDVSANVVIGDPLNPKLEAGKAPTVETGAVLDGMGYLVVTEGYTNITGERLFMKQGDRVIWYGTMWILMQHSSVTSINEQTGDVVLSSENIKCSDGKSVEVALNAITKFINSMFPIGHMLITCNPANPSTYGYAGVWELVGDDLTLASVTNGDKLGTIEGDNYPLVPVQQHSHSAAFHGHALPPHNHGILLPRGDQGYKNGGGNSIWGWSHNWRWYTESASAGTPSGTVSVYNAGTASARLDVRGKRIHVFAWRRIS